ncbi:MAG: hypothetical protein HFJ20_03565 [Clostridia bacterium]|nr:hypothetical protein [Clostridia bacterium]
MGTHYIPRNVKGEGRILYIFSTKSLITTCIGGGIGIILYYIFKTISLNAVGVILLGVFALLGFAVGTVKIPHITGIKFTKNVAGDSIDDIVLRYAKFKMNKKIYKYTKEEE